MAIQSQGTQRKVLGIFCTLGLVVLWTQYLTPSLQAKGQTFGSVSLSQNGKLVQFSLYACDKKGDFVTGLSNDDITIFEDGTPQVIVDFREMKEQPLEVAVLVDTSASMADGFQYIRSATRLFFEKMLRHNYDLATLMGFDEKLWVFQDMTKDTKALATATQILRTRRAKTRLYDGITLTLSKKMQFQEGFRRALIVISDGRDFGSTTSYDTLVELLRGIDVTVFVLSLQERNELLGFREWGTRLDDLSTQTGGCTFLYYHPGEITLHFSEVYKQMRNRYAVSYRSTTSLNKAAFHRIKVESRQKGLKLIYRKTLSMREGM